MPFTPLNPAGNFPLLDLVGPKAVFLDDWRFDDEVLPYATQCRRYDGSFVEVLQPQNRPGKAGHLTYQRHAPNFATTKFDDMGKLEKLAADDPVTGQPLDVNASKCFRRSKVYAFRTKISKFTCMFVSVAFSICFSARLGGADLQSSIVIAGSPVAMSRGPAPSGIVA